MAVERAPSAVSALVRIDVQDHPRNVAPVGALRVSVEKAEVSDHALLVVRCERWVTRTLHFARSAQGRRDLLGRAGGDRSSADGLVRLGCPALCQESFGASKVLACPIVEKRVD